jgi:hypothetical protein
LHGCCFLFGWKAAARNHFKAIELLLECANVEESHVEEALQVAAAVDAIEAIQSLSSHTNTHVGINSTKGVESAMLVACRAGHITTLQTLRANHPDLNWGVVTHDGLNCVGLAAFYNHVCHSVSSSFIHSFKKYLIFLNRHIVVLGNLLLDTKFSTL